MKFTFLRVLKSATICHTNILTNIILTNAEQINMSFSVCVFSFPLSTTSPDFECLAEEIDKPEDDEIKTYNYQEHKPCGFMLNLATAVDSANHEVLRRGVDAVDVFCNKLNEIEIASKRNYYKIE